MPTDVHITIDRLVLEGIDLPPTARPRLAAAVSAELGRLLAEGGLSSDLSIGGARRAVHGGAVELGEGATDPVALATQIAGAIYGGLGE
jgi:hypothetical protein